jgi:hypothetical protein
MVFGIGLSKTGTTSLAEALTMVGVPTLHLPDKGLMLAGRFSEALAGYRGATDISVSFCFEALDAAYPGSRFVLTMRDRDTWVESVEAHMHRRPWPERGTPAAELRVRIYGTHLFERDRLMAAYDAFHARVHRYFADRPRDLVVMHIIDGQGWEVLCPFLGVAVPGVPFPRRNVRTPVAAAM